MTTLSVSEHEGSGDTGAPIVVLVHGSMDRGASFAKCLRYLRDLHVVRYDRRGYGRSVDAGPPATLAEHTDDLVELIDERPAVVVGHSLGGDIALAAAARSGVPILGVGVYEAPMSWTRWWPTQNAGGMAILGNTEGGTGGAAEAFLRRMVGDEWWESQSEPMQAARRAEGAALVAELISLREGSPYELEAIRVPVLVATGTESSDHHARASRELAAAVGTASELTVIEGARHGAHASHPHAFAAFVRAVVERGCEAARQ